MSLINLIPEAFTGSLGWTLVHSLWQAALLLIIVTLIDWLTSVSKASSRYLIYCCALISQLVFTVITLIIIYEPKVSNNNLIEFFPDFTTIAFASNSNFAPSYFQSIISMLNNHMDWLISGWFVGVVILTIRFLGGMTYIQFLRMKFKSVSNEWDQILATLSRQIGIKQLVHLGESIHIDRPIVVGIIKPIILLPIGLISHLPVSQVEAILLHELSHIKRHDYLINIIQSIIEVLLFFNPFIWIISNKIKLEREHCCDDLVLQAGTSRIDYVKALANVQAFHVSNSPALALAFGGHKFQLLKRIKRIMEKSISPKTNKLTPASVLILLLVAIVCVAWMTPNSEVTQHKVENAAILSAGIALPLDTNDIDKQKNKSVKSEKYSRKRITIYDENGEAYEEVIEEFDGDEEPTRSFSFIIPPIPDLPNLPSIPNAPFHGFHYSFDNDSTPHYRHFSDEDIDRWKEFGEEMAERFRDFEYESEEFDHRMDLWADNFEHNFHFDFEKFDETLNHSLGLLHDRLSDINDGDLHERLNESLHELESNLERLDDRLKVHEGEIKDLERKMKDYENELQSQLIKDGYLQPGERVDSFNWTGDRLTVNGIKIKEEDIAKYEAINKKYFKGTKGYFFKN